MAQLAQRGQRVLVLIWDNASWHVSQEVQAWIARHNAAAKRSGQGVRILVAGLPTKSPWLNKIEPKWKHGKEAIVEADGSLDAQRTWKHGCVRILGPRRSPIWCNRARRPGECVPGASLDKRGTRASAVRTSGQNTTGCLNLH